MSNHTYRVIEIVGTSADGVDDAIKSGLARASETMRNLDWFEVQSVRGHLTEGAVAHYQVTMKVGFRLDDSSPAVSPPPHRAPNTVPPARGPDGNRACAPWRHLDGPGRLGRQTRRGRSAPAV